MSSKNVLWTCLLLAPMLAAAQAESMPAQTGEALRTPQALVGTPAPDFALRDLGGTIWRLSALRGKRILVLQFASTSCRCGQTALIALNRIQQRFRERGVQALAIGFEAAPLYPPAEFAAKEGLLVPFLDDPALKTARTYGVRWPPCVIVVDRLGIVRWTHDEFLDDVFELTCPVVESLAAADEAWNPHSQYGKLYPRGTPMSVTGAVAAVERCRPLPGMSPGIALTLKQGARGLRVHLGPAWHVETQAVRIGAGDAVAVSGACVYLNGKDVLLAAKVVRGEDMLLLRDADGRPLWELSAAPAAAPARPR